MRPVLLTRERLTPILLFRLTVVAAIACSVAVGRFGVDSSAFAAAPKAKKRAELVGPIAPSIHVPPVRTAPPARTRTIERRPQYDAKVTAHKQRLPYRLESLRLAIEDQITTFGDAYPDGLEFLRRWRALWKERDTRSPAVEERFRKLRDEALLANPLLEFDRLLVLKREKGQLGLPTNHQCNTCLGQHGYDNELAVLSPVRPDGQLVTLFRPRGGAFVGEMDLHFDADRLLFTMPNGRTWQIHEMGMDGRRPRQVSREVPDVDNFDPCYLPDGRIVYSSTASYTGVPCWHGRERACCLYAMDADGANVRQLCFDQDLDLHPSVLPNGQVIYSRWDYTGILHAYVRPLMVMNPDGTSQRAVYGSNSYYPNCLFFPRAVPGSPNKIAAVLAGYHGQNRMGELAVLDISQGWSGESGIVHRVSHRGEPIVPVVRDFLTQNAKLQFLHPCPLSEKYILTAMQPGRKQPWGIYLVDVFDNITPVLTDPKYDFTEPLPIQKRPMPRAIPDRTDPSRDDAVVVLHDIYKGPGLAGVPRGTIKRLRVAAYHFGFPGMAGPDKIGRGGPWEAMRILGTVPIYEDGSAKFRVPANTPLTLQALDAEGKAVQLMRSWYTAMPGETASCVGCHETPRDSPIVRNDIAATSTVSEIEPWYGPARGFDFARDVQPALDKHCAGCHDGQPREDGQVIPDLRDERFVANYEGLPLTRLGASRIDPSIPSKFADRFQPCTGMPHPYGELKMRYTPAYDALIPFIRRVNIEDGVLLLRPGEYHADTSELVQMLMKGHHGVRLDQEAWDRFVTWIDLNGPCHGTWGDVADIPRRADRHRHELGQSTGGPKMDPEFVPVSLIDATVSPIIPAAATPTADERRRVISGLLAQLKGTAPTFEPAPTDTMTVDLDDGLTIELVRVPPGRFVMGDTTGEGEADEWPASVVTIERGFWISRTEITNVQFRRFLPEHSSGVFTKRQIDRDGPGIQLDDPNQPAVRVSWNDAMEFCRLLSEKTGRRVTLPTEAQWEYAARAGTTTALCYGETDADFSDMANVADRSLACLYEGTAGVAVLQPIPAVMQFDDQAIGTTDVASYRANALRLYDVHGNAAEWTRSAYRSYPYDANDGRNDIARETSSEKRVVRGGSFYDRPKRCRSSHRLAFPAWQGVHNVGFRIVVED
ncbi:MAG: SUMF1/EgtB/PvdO family nonheme iron enzyme [Planctomycetes bacterium]|nr:SUMF1/EgtB/PvdO family nonheme iron enzyme [Planctomycetota bacterium]MBL7037614.1 SUMF1/EgtB/PvdO family nonheme iron enzyme [Pirellulaceae bacterium]